MNTRRDNDEPPTRVVPTRDEREQAAGTVTCSVCLARVPGSGAQSVEGQDYVWHFCGEECFKRWQDRAERCD